MATQIAQAASSLPLYRIDVETYGQMVASGALDGLDVELVDGLLVDKHSHREDPIHRLDIGTFGRMVDSGALEGERVELLEGLLVAVSPQSREHADVIVRLTRHFAVSRAWLRVQLPLEAEWASLPEPDLALVERHPSHRHPRVALLVVEVAVSSHRKDRDTKANMYAWAPVPTYWLVDVPGKVVEVRTDPGPGGYRCCDVYEAGMSIPSPDPGVEDVDVGTLLEPIDGPPPPVRAG
jgi:Uma2 family endonuclease